MDVHLRPPGVVKTRGVLQHYSIRDLNITPNQFTKRKNGLLLAGKLDVTKIKIGTQFPTHVLHKGRPDSKCLADLERELEELMRLMPPHLKGAPGEIVGRALFKRLQYEGHPITAITRKRNVGYEALEGLQRRKDLSFVYEERIGSKYQVIVENKNCAENAYFASSDWFYKLIDSAIRTKAQPVLMASFLPAKSLRKCQRIGIATHVYGRQFIDSTIASQVKKLYPNIHRELFQFVNVQQPFANYQKIDRRSMRDLEALRDPSWIETAHRQWQMMSPWHRRIADALGARDLGRLDAILDSHA